MNTSQVRARARQLLRGHYGIPLVILVTTAAAGLLLFYVADLLLAVLGIFSVEDGFLVIGTDTLEGWQMWALGGVAILVVAAGLLFVSVLQLGGYRWFFRFAAEQPDGAGTLFYYFSSPRRYGRAVLLELQLMLRTLLWYGLLLLPGLVLCAFGILAAGGVDAFFEIQAALPDSAFNQDAYLLLGLGSLLTMAGALIATVFCLRYWLARYILVSDETVTARQAVRISTRMMAGHIWETVGMALSFIGWFLLTVVTCGISLLFVLPYFSIAMAVFAKQIIDSNVSVSQAPPSPPGWQP